jgi:hypothetical protein
MWRFIATVLAPVVVVDIVWLVVTPPGAAPWLAFPTFIALFISLPMSMLGLAFGDYIAPQAGLGRLAVFTLSGAVMGATVWIFFNVSAAIPFGVLPGAAAGFVAALWKPWVVRTTAGDH